MCSIRTFLFAILLTGAFCAPVNSSDLIYPTGYGGESAAEFKDLTWNRYTTENFVIVSIDDAQGKWLSENLEKIKTWGLTRWGFNDVKFSKECRIFCVPNQALFKKLFNLDQSKFEIREELTAIWLLLDEKPTIAIPPLVTAVSLYEFEIKNSVKIPVWFKKGSAALNTSVPNIRQKLVKFTETFKKDEPIYDSGKLFTFTEEDYKSDKQLYEQESIMLCLMLRKEFGEAKLQGFLRIASNNDPQDVLKVVYGFNDYDHFDKQFYVFMKDLSRDMTENKTPNSYLEIKPVR